MRTTAPFCKYAGQAASPRDVEPVITAAIKVRVCITITPRRVSDQSCGWRSGMRCSHRELCVAWTVLAPSSSDRSQVLGIARLASPQST